MVEQVGVRALQQHASRVIRSVAEGEIVGVTDRGRLVAHLIPANADPLTVLALAGQARPARRSLRDLAAPLPSARGKKSLSRLLAQSRVDER
jgi:antitoxin (DNA-binding transcriptional repressor) of toxin-antitoxin stability system